MIGRILLRRAYGRGARRGLHAAVRACGKEEGYPAHELLPLAALSPTMESGGVARWLKEEGEAIRAGDIVLEIETDKATVDFEAQDDSFLAKILVQAPASDIPVGSPLAVLVEDEEDVGAFATATVDEFGATETTESAATAPATAPAPAPAPAKAATSKAPPRTPRIKFRHGRRDLIDAARAPAASSATSGKAATTTPSPEGSSSTVDSSGYVDIPLTPMRKVIASRLTESKATVPHYYSRMTCSIDALLQFRQTLKESGVKISVNDLVILASALSLRDMPEINAFWDESSQQVRENASVDISVAVATDGGLITPIVFACDSRGLKSINQNVAELAQKARSGKLQPEEYQGGSFTISNLGMYQISEFTAVINPPQSCILAVGGGIPVAVMQENGELSTETQMTVSLSSDRRVVDEASAAAFLRTFRNYCENPHLLST
eukprot:g1500.t1